MKKIDNIVLVRGLAREAGHWGDSLKVFQNYFPDAKIQTPDLPGAGVNYQKKVPIGLKNFVPILREQVTLKEGENNLIMGLSLGGMCVLEWTKQHPKDFKGAVIMNASLGDHSLPWKRMKPEKLLQIALSHTQPKEKAERLVLEIVSNNPAGYDEHLKLACELLKKRPMKFDSILKQLVSGALYKMNVKEAPVPILALGSMKDHLVSTECTIAMGEKLNCEVRLHPWAGHELPLDDPEWVCQQTKSWVESLN